MAYLSWDSVRIPPFVDESEILGKGETVIASFVFSKQPPIQI
jgi:hypothetical protein